MIVSAVELVYDQNWTLKYNIEDGRIYHKNWQLKDRIEEVKLYDKIYDPSYKLQGYRRGDNLYGSAWTPKGYIKGTPQAGKKKRQLPLRLRDSNVLNSFQNYGLT
jgi:hypothetical protein